jgi:hypothetical protein
MSRESLIDAFKKCGASYAEIAGKLLVSSWPSPALAALCVDRMHRAGLQNVKSYANPDNETTVEGELPL